MQESVEVKGMSNDRHKLHDIWSLTTKEELMTVLSGILTVLLVTSGSDFLEYVGWATGACALHVQVHDTALKTADSGYLTRKLVDVAHDKIHAQDCASCEAKTGKIDRFSRKITLEGELSDADRKRLLEIADRCPVHRTLESESLIETEEA